MSLTGPLQIVHLDKASMGDDITLSRPDCEHHWTSYQTTSADEAPDRLRTADIAILNKVPVSEALLEQAPQLKMIAISATGYNHIDLDACQKRNIAVCNVRGYAATTVAEHSFAMILSLSRSVKAYDRDVRQGAWQKSDSFCLFTQPVWDLRSATLGLIGSGDIGSEVERLAQAFGMRVLRSDRKGVTTPRPGYVRFDTILTECDVISLHCPLTPQTRGILGAEEFAAMTRTPLIINTSRGGLIDEHALLAALDRGQISGAGCDVLETEPPKQGNILLDRLSHPHLIVTPHTGWASTQARQTLWAQLISHIDAFAVGTPQNNLCQNNL